MPQLNRKDTVYYARIIPNTGIYEVCELFVRTATEDYFAGMDKRDKRTYLFSYNAIGDTVFTNRKDALSKVRIAESNKQDISSETYYEEY